MKLCKEVLKGI